MNNNRKLSVLLGFHSSIPFSAQTDNNIEITNNCNFISEVTNLLGTYPNIKASFHLSSNLISHLDKSLPDFSSRIRKLIDLNQLELLSGGIYEPLFPCIPEEDRQHQISLMNRFINHTFGYIPHGAWIPEHMWESSITPDIAKSNIQYTCLPGEFFKKCNLDTSELTGYFVTEDRGRKIGVFPITFELHKLLEELPAVEAINLISSQIINSHNESPAIVLIYDRTKTTSNHTDKLKEALEILNSKSGFLETKLFGTYFHANKPVGRVYLPPAQTNGPDSFSDNWKMFLLKSHEANLLHKKMLRVSKKVNAAKEGKSRFKVIKEMINKAHELLLRGQNSDSFTVSLFNSGIMLPKTRAETYSSLIKAENLIDSAARTNSKWIQVSEIDYDCDGNDEIIIETETQNIYLSPALGGVVLEHDYKPKEINILNTFSPIIEKPFNSTNGSQFQAKHPKLHFHDHFLRKGLTFEQYKAKQFNHLTEKIIKHYEVEKIKAKEETCKVTLNRQIKLNKLGSESSIQITKQFNTRAGESFLLVEYILTNPSLDKIEFLFGTEFNFNITSQVNNESFFYLNNDTNNKTPNPLVEESEELPDINQISFFSNTEKLAFALSWNKPCMVYRSPTETTHQINQKKIFQGSNVLALWHVALEPNSSWELSVTQELKNLNPEI